MNQQHDLQALKTAVEEAKAIHRAATKAVLDAKRIAATTRFRVNVAQRAYINARPSRPKPLSAQEAEDAEAIFADMARTRATSEEAA